MYPPRNPKVAIKMGVPIFPFILFGMIPVVILILKLIRG